MRARVRETRTSGGILSPRPLIGSKELRRHSATLPAAWLRLCRRAKTRDGHDLPKRKDTARALHLRPPPR